ncbi:MAG: arsenate reductase (glutaredoxin) [Bdellovibrionaceae bacterium]|jgi:arsenate reductase (glutaredoxin)|nr:arsenate reductase (glutaredoxin) [Pseudobdellovibrionaceae bacterium]
MSNIVIYHNPKCSKSRQTLELLKSKGVEPEVVEYLKNPLNEFELKSILQKLGGDGKQLVRVKEEVFKETKPSIDSHEEIVKVLAKFPKLMERPLVVSAERAVLGRPPENVLELLS